MRQPSAPQPTFAAQTSRLIQNDLSQHVEQKSRHTKFVVWLASCVALLLVTVSGSAQSARLAGQLGYFGSSLNSAAAVAVDGQQNAYVVTATGVVYEEPYNATAGTYGAEVQLFTTQAAKGSSIAVDKLGQNLYLGTGASDTVEHWQGSNSTFTYENTFSGLKGAPGVALDPSGDVYIVDGSANLYEEVGSGATWVQSTPLTNLSNPNYIAIDPSGNIFVASATNTIRPYSEITIATAGGKTTYTATNLNLGATGPLGIAVDSSDDVYIATSTDVDEATLSGGTYTELPYYQYAASGVALDSVGNVYMVATAPVQSGQGTKLTQAGGYLNFGSVYPDQPGSLTAVFTWTGASATVGIPTAVTEGLTNYDFSVSASDSVTTSCYNFTTKAGKAMTKGASCTVLVAFNPKSSGSRLGAVNLWQSNNKTKAATGFIGGVGYTPLAVYQEANLVQTIACPAGTKDANGNTITCAPAENQGRGLSLDPAGNIYVADQSNKQVLAYLYNASSKSYSTTPVTIIANTGVQPWDSCSPSATALDGEGNLFVACNGLYTPVGGSAEGLVFEIAGAVNLVTSSSTTLPQTPTYFVVGSNSLDDHLSADAAGNLYSTTYSPSSNQFLKISSGTYTTTVLASAPSNARFVGAVTDAAGNTFAPDYNNSILYELAAGSGTLQTLYTSKSTMPFPHAIAEDAAGDLYVTTTNGNVGQGTSPLLEFAAGSYTSDPSKISILGSDSIAVSSDGNVFTVYNNTTLYEYTRGLYNLTFPGTTTIGQTSAPQTVVLENAGSAPLTISPPASGTNPSLSSNFIFEPSSTCPALSSSSNPFTLGVGSTCTDVIAFQPQQFGTTISGQLITTDNSANTPNSTQTINITATPASVAPTITVPTVTGTLGQPVNLTATVSGPGVAPTGQVTFTVSSNGVSGPTKIATCQAGTGKETCTYTGYPTSTVLNAGNNTITVNFIGEDQSSNANADSNYLSASQTGTLTLAGAVTSTALMATPGTVTYGGSVALSARVTSGYGTPSGTVTFTDGTLNLGSATITNGVATLSTTALPGGQNQTLTATYAANGNYAGSTGTATENVNLATPTVSVTGATGTLGQNATLTATVTGVTNGIVPSGAVTFTVGTGSAVQATCTPVSGSTNSETCTATYPTSSGVTGGNGNKITATVAADGNYTTASNNSSSLTLAGAPTTTTLSTSPSTSTYGQSDTLNISVSSSYGTPTGSVQITDNGNAYKTVSLTSPASGPATATVTLPTNFVAGSHNFVATYVAVQNYATSTSSAAPLTVSQATPTVSVQSTTGTLGQNATLTATITGVTGGGVPSGAVTFTVGTGSPMTATCTPASTSPSNFAETCTASYPTNTGVQPNGNTITASLASDTNYVAASNTGTLTVAPAVTTTTLTLTPSTTTYGSSVNLSAKVASGYGTPAGMVTFTDGNLNLGTGTLNNGVATLSTTSLPGGQNQTITATYAANGSFAGSSGTAQENVSTATPTVSVPSVSGTLGQAVTLTATVAPVTNGAVPTGSVQFVVGSGQAITAACATSNGVESCSASYPNTSGVTPGLNNITANYGGDGNYAVTSGKGVLTDTAGTTVSVTASPATYTYGGGNLTLTATVSASPYGTPTGQVTFMDGSTMLGTVQQLQGGTASVQVSNLTGGPHTITASYADTANSYYSPSSGTLKEMVALATPTLTVPSATGTLGQNATLTATVTGVTGGVAPTGGVSFTVGSGTAVPATCTPASTSPSNNAETCTASYPTSSGLVVGTNQITATYTADTNYAAATNNTSQLTMTANTTTTVGSSANPSTYGSSVTLSATVSSGGYGTPTGSVTFTEGSTTLGTVPLQSGTAPLTLANLSGGSHKITATYNGTSSYGGSNGILTQTVNTAAAAIAVQPATGTLGQNATLTATVTGVSGGVAPTGGVSFTVGTGTSVPATCNPASTSPSNNAEVCTASYPTGNGLAAGPNTITATFAGDTNYTSGSNTNTLTMAAATTSTTLSLSPSPSTYGGNVVISAGVSSNGYGTPTGTVTFTDGGNTLTTVSLTNGTASFQTAGLTGGAHKITATYNGAGSYATSTATQPQTVNPASPASDNATGTGTYGAATTPVTITVPYPGVAFPTGAITVADNFGESVAVQSPSASCTAVNQVLTCAVNLPTAKEPVTLNGATNALTITQLGDGNYSGTSGTGKITMNPTAGSTAASASGNGTWGAATTAVTVKIPYSGATAPTGTVTVTDTFNETASVAPNSSACSASGGNLVCTVNLPTANEPVSTGNTVNITEAADGNYSAASGAGSIQISKVAATTGDTVQGSGTYGASTSPVTVKIPYAGPVAPTGTITVSDTSGNSVQIQATSSSCSASSGTLTCTGNLPTANEPVNPNASGGNGNSLSVTQLYDNNYSGSSGSGLMQIGKAPVYGGDIANGSGTVGAATTPVAIQIFFSGTTPPAGAITVTDSLGETVTIAAAACTSANGSLNCTANLPTSKQPVSNTSLSVMQAEDSNYLGNNGGGTLSIGKIAYSNTDSVSGTGNYAALTTPITVTIPYSGPVPPTGTITVNDSFGDTLAIQPGSCTASGGALTCFGDFPTNHEPEGKNPVTVNQGPDPNYAGSIGSGTIVLNQAPVYSGDTATGSGVFGAATTPVVVSIPYGGVAAPTGPVTVTDTYGNTATVQSSVCNFSVGLVHCTVNLPTATEPVGKNTVQITQGSDPNYLGTSGTGQVTIAPAGATGNDTAAGTGVYGAPTTPIKVQIPYVGNTPPTGAITVADTHGNSVVIQTTACTAAGGVLTCSGLMPTANEPVGGNIVTVNQVLDPNYGGSSGSGTISIGKAPATGSDSALGKGTYGAATTPVTVTIPFSGAAAPTGAVTVTDTHGNTVTVAGTTCNAGAGVLICTVNLPTANEPLQSNPVTVTQADDANYSGSTGPGTVVIGKAVATTTDTATGSGIYGAPTTAVTVTIPYAGTVAPSGPITLTDGYNNTVTLQASACTASGGALTCIAELPTANEPVGTNAVTVNQAFDNNYSGSSGTGAVTINPAGSSASDSATGTGTYGAPSSNVTVVIPYSGSTAPTGIITLSDTYGNATTVTTCNAAGGALVCSASLPTANEPVGMNVLAVTQAADANHGASTGPGSLNIKPANASTTDSASGTGTYGAPSTPVTVTIPFGGTAAPTGMVTVTDTLGNTASVAGSACTTSGQTLTCTLGLSTADDPLGMNQVTVTQAGDSNYTGSSGTGSITIGISTVSPSGNTATSVQNVTITQGTPQTLLTVALAYDGAVAPSGAVSFTVAGGQSVTATCTSGASPEICTAAYPTGSLAMGTYVITATEAADPDYPGGSSTATLTVEQGAVAPILDTVSNVSNVLVPAGTQSATLTANITYTGPLPTGTLVFSLPNGTSVTGTCTAGPSPLSCQATYPTGSLTVGTYVITATEAADSNYAQGSATALLTVEPNATTPVSPVLATGSAVNSVLVQFGQPTANLSGTVAYTGPAPTGAVSFTVVGGANITVPASCSTGSSPMTCTAIYPTGSLGIGGYRIQMTEAADANYPAGTAIGTLTVTNIASSTGDTVSGTGSYGAATTTVIATIPYTGSVPPSGAVTVTDSQNNTATVPGSSCSAANNILTCPLSLPTVNVAAGTDAATVSQVADSIYAASSGAGSITINPAAVTNGDTATGTGIFGQATTPVSISIPYAGAVAPTGAVAVTDSLGNTVTVQASTCTAASGTLNCSANLPTANEPLGGNPVVVGQAADANYAGSTGSGTVTINKAGPGNNDTATGTGTFGAATTPVIVSIPYSGSAAPTGAITVTDTYKESVTVQAALCSAAKGTLTCNVNLPTANEPVGANTLSVNEASDPNYSGSSGAGTVTINKVPSTATDTTTGTGVYGQPTTPVTVMIPYTGNTPSTGAITVTDTHGNTVTVPASSCTANAAVLTCNVTLPTANVPAGTDTLTVTQAGDGNYTGSTGTGSLTLNKAAVTTTDSATGTGTYGAATTPVTVTIPFVGASAPTGAVTLTDTYGETATAQASTCTAGKASLTCTISFPTANEPVGANTVTVNQAADPNYGGSSGGGTVTINKAAAGADNATGTGTYGAQTTPVTVTIPFTGATPTGDVTVADTHGNTVTVPANTCTAAKAVLSCTVTLPTQTEPAGANAVTVNQALDPNHAASTGSGTVTINKAAVTTGDTATGSGTVGDATTPVTVTIPYAGVTAPTGAVTLTDTLGNTVTVQGSTCTAAKGTLSCTANLPTANEPVGSNTLTVAQAGDANYSGSTGTGTVTMLKEDAGKGDTATGTGTYGAATTPATVTIPYAGTTVPTGAVTLTDAHGNTVTVQGNACTAAKGTLSCAANLPSANVPAGADAVTVSQAPDANTGGSTGSGTVTINKAAATTTDTATASGTYGAATTPVTVTIPYAGTAAPTGTVTVSDANGNTVTAQASTCTAAKGVLTCTVNLPTANVTAGTDAITVTQAADANYLGSTGTGSVVMSKLGSTLTAPTVSPMNAPYGTSVTLTETVPTGETGTVTFANGSTVLGTAKIVNGVATLTTTALPVGTASITAATSGDSNFGAATSPAVTDNVGSLATKTVLVSSQPTTTPGTVVTFTATVTGTGTVAGTVTFYDGTTALGTGTVANGVATLTTGKLAAGTHQITAGYTPASGSLLAPSTSAAVTQTVANVPSSVSLNSSLNPAIAEQTVTFTASVPAAVAGTMPTGMVTFYDGTTVLGSVQLNGSGVAAFATAKMTGGMHKVTAVYAGDGTYATATSATVMQAVQDYTVGNTTPKLTVDPGKSAAFNITVNPMSGVQFGAPVTLTVAGLPANFAASFGTVTVTPGSAGANSTMNVQTYAQKLTAALEHQQRVKSYEAALFWASLLPLLAMRRIRRRLPKALLMLLLCLGSLGAIAPLTGCGGGYFGPGPASYTLTVTGTAGALQRSTTVTLNVQ